MSWRVEVFFDGLCPLCSREVALWRWLDRGRGRLHLVDISSSSFEPEQYGLTHAQVTERIHGRLPDGRVIEGLEVFRRAYGALGLGFLLAPTDWPLLRPLAVALYARFARWRARRRCAPGACARPGGAEQRGAS